MEKTVEAIRIVTMDYYLTKPIQNLDSCFSELQNTVIKSVPIIRVFGSNKFGQKVCAHIHGVYPYLYVPFDDNNVENHTSYVQQLANSLDKAINISFGKMMSTRQYVYKILLVKGIPFYGFHNTDMHFLKIYLFNPGLVRRVANLLLSGAIMNRSFQPHESHIPYILQFMIDHNLYGMSQLYVPEQLLLHRSSNKSEESHIPQKLTQSAIEFDIMAIHILNRALLYQKTDTNCVNPGIASLWEDEKLRRGFASTAELEPPPSQIREYVNLSRSDQYFRQVLKAKVAPKDFEEENRMDSTAEMERLILMDEIPSQKTSQKTNHSGSLFSDEDETENLNEKLDETIVNEEIVMSLTQNTLSVTLNEEDYELLEIMRELEENDGKTPDTDSVLAPVSSQKPQNQSTQLTQVINATIEPEDEDELDFTVMNFDPEFSDEDELNTTTMSENFPQLDGGYDLRRPKKKSAEEKTWFHRDRPPSSLKELQINIKKVKFDEKSTENVEKTPEKSKIEEKSTENEEIGTQKSKIEEIPSSSVEKTPQKVETNILDDENLTEKLVAAFLSPTPGPSGITNAFPEYKTPEKTISSDDEYDSDPMIESFYDRTLIFDLPSSEEEEVSPISAAKNEEKVVIHPLKDPPLPEDVKKSIYEFHEARKPVYKDFNDITKKREVGYNILHVAGDCLKACPSFESQVLNTSGSVLNSIRKQSYRNLTGIEKPESVNQINECLVTDENVILDCAKKPPTVLDAKSWVKARKTIKPVRKIEDESPAKAKVEKPSNVLQEEMQENVEEDKEVSVIDATFNEFDVTLGDTEGKKQETYQFNVSGVLAESQDGRKSATPSSSRKSMSLMRRKRRGMLSLKKRLQINKALEESAVDSPATSQTSENSFQSSETFGDISLKDSPDSEASRLNPNSTYGFSLSSTDISLVDKSQHFKVDLENLKTANAKCEYSYLTLMNLELHCQTRNDLKPDPMFDGISALFFTIINDVPENSLVDQKKTAMIVCGLSELEVNIFRRSDMKTDIFVVPNEISLFEHLIDIVRHWDPDIFSGYEIERFSWGYLIDRGNALELDMISLLSRILPKEHVTQESKEVPQMEEPDPGQGMDREYENDIQIRGRILLNVWRLIRHEIALTSYTFENVLYHIMHQRYLLHSHKFLTRLWQNPKTMWIVADYYLKKVRGTIDILDTLDLIGRTCELAKLFGIQFFEVLSRGSQFRVESMMMRIAKARNYVGVSPSVQQRAHMRAPEYLPLILEPQSRLFTDPLIVLDFQSLYPSVIIGYNYCFSTCLGRVEHLGTKDPFEFGATNLKIPPELLQELIEQNQITISPCGVAFVTKEVRKGVLPQMLNEILDTRLMVKQSMKLHKSNKVLQRVLHSRQLGLKLIANVTYGYTAANFSGRMPCVEVGDSVVSKGRETLERAIKFVEANSEWRAEVVYGDTDSLFILLPGRTRDEAFTLGQEIAEAVTLDNPSPIKLKFEKVYQPCILQTKKRYVGYMYETPDQKDPIYEAKGIETVRRDGCPIVAKTLEKTLRILFETLDVSRVKRFINRQFTKLLKGETSIQDLIFAKEFRGMKGYKPGACVPALELARKWVLKDPRNIPLSGERVPFVIANGPPGLPLIRLVRSPYEMLEDKGLKVNSFYYITKVIIPPLNRCLLLIGVDVREWFQELPRTLKITGATTHTDANLGDFTYKKSTIAQYFATTNCVVECGNQTTNEGVCEKCQENPQKAVLALNCKIMKLDRRLAQIQKICHSCSGRTTNFECISLDCPILYKLNNAKHNFSQTENMRKLLENEFF
ncbi:DNA polymerase zeta catalytic subunit [Culicoides brevitarsis]|uniref:DNA polymerase zeta catalytic subunit n=1 Tax=Culicoides brevitarsis TaxID=469753 RepID=UPI00307B20C3